MLMFLFLFLILAFVAYMLRNAEMLGWLIVTLLAMLSILTPFWPFVLLGVVAIIKIKRDEYRETRRRDNLRKQYTTNRKES